jgi:hypothetical protein
VEDAKLLSQAREDAFRLVEDDPKIAAAANRPVKNTLASRYRDRLKLAAVG